VVENLAYDAGILDAGDDLDGAATSLTGFDVDVEYPLQPLRPEPAPDLIRGHGGMAFGGCAVCCLIGRYWLSPPAPPGGCDDCPVLAVGCEDAVEAGEVDAGFWNERSEARDEVQRLEDHVSGAVAPGVFQRIADLAVFGK